MLQILNLNYEKILNKFSHQFSINFLKIGLHFVLLLYWLIIILGTFLVLD